MNVERINQVIMEEMGECGLEALISAVQFYLMYADEKELACVEDKLLLLTYLFYSPDFGIYDEFNPLKHFEIRIIGVLMLWKNGML